MAVVLLSCMNAGCACGSTSEYERVGRRLLHWCIGGATVLLCVRGFGSSTWFARVVQAALEGHVVGAVQDLLGSK